MKNGKRCEIIGIEDGYHGLIFGEYHEMKPSDFSGILTVGGTILGTSRTPYSKMQVVGGGQRRQGEKHEAEL